MLLSKYNKKTSSYYLHIIANDLQCCFQTFSFGTWLVVMKHPCNWPPSRVVRGWGRGRVSRPGESSFYRAERLPIHPYYPEMIVLVFLGGSVRRFPIRTFIAMILLNDVRVAAAPLGRRPTSAR